MPKLQVFPTICPVTKYNLNQVIEWRHLADFLVIYPPHPTMSQIHRCAFQTKKKKKRYATLRMPFKNLHQMGTSSSPAHGTFYSQHCCMFFNRSRNWTVQWQKQKCFKVDCCAVVIVAVLTAESNFMVLCFMECSWNTERSDPLGLLIRQSVCPCGCLHVVSEVHASHWST